MGCPRVVMLVLMLAASPAAAQQISLAVPLDTLIARAARDSTDPLVLYDLGVGYWASGKFDGAEAALRRADAIDPRVAEVRWGPEAGEAFTIANDPDITLAVEQVSNLPRLLGHP